METFSPCRLAIAYHNLQTSVELLPHHFTIFAVNETMRPGFAARRGRGARFFPAKTLPSEDLSVGIMTNALVKRGLSTIAISVTRSDDWEDEYHDWLCFRTAHQFEDLEEVQVGIEDVLYPLQPLLAQGTHGIADAGEPHATGEDDEALQQGLAAGDVFQLQVRDSKGKLGDVAEKRTRWDAGFRLWDASQRKVT